MNIKWDKPKTFKNWKYFYLIQYLSKNKKYAIEIYIYYDKKELIEAQCVTFPRKTLAKGFFKQKSVALQSCKQFFKDKK